MTRSVKPTTYFVIGESRTNADNSITMIYGSSRKAVITSCRDALKRYNAMCKEEI